MQRSGPRLSQAAREPALPVVAHAENALFAIVVAVVAARVAEDGREEPEAGSSPRGDGDAKGDNGREEVDDDEHGGAESV